MTHVRRFWECVWEGRGGGVGKSKGNESSKLMVRCDVQHTTYILHATYILQHKWPGGQIQKSITSEGCIREKYKGSSQLCHQRDTTGSAQHLGNVSKAKVPF